jgi:TRAP transporter TAXI family solute receptor
MDRISRFWPRLGSRALAATLLAYLAGLPASEAAEMPAHVVLGTATPGGGFPAYGAAIIEAIREVDPSLTIEAKNTKGSTENLPLLEDGKLDIGLVTGEAAYEAFAGIGRPPAKLKVLAAMYSSPGMFVVRADSPYRTIQDLRGKPVAFGAKGSGLVILARYVLDGIGLDQNRDFEPVYLDRAGDGPAMVLDGRVAALWGAGSGWPGFTKMAERPEGARFIAPSEAEARQIVAKHPFLKPQTIPARSYPGQDQPVRSVGSWSLILARPTLDEGVAYRLARALHRGEKRVGDLLPQAAETTAANTVAAVPNRDMLHPGVARYLHEIGLLQ